MRALGVTTDLVTACSIVYKVGKSQAWERFNRGQLDFPAFRNGRSVIVPVAPLLRLLGAAAHTRSPEPGPAPRPVSSPSFDGAKLRRLREAAGLSSTAFAAEVGISRTHLFRLETGKCQPRGHLRPRLAEKLGVSVDALAASAAGSEAA